MHLGLLVMTLYIFWFLHQTTTRSQCSSWWCLLYIFWFLHQTTTLLPLVLGSRRCISFDSYIKPQLLHLLLISVSSCISFDSYIKPQLSALNWAQENVVYLLIPTSNHNYRGCGYAYAGLYIFWFLHQTTTSSTWLCSRWCCISFDSYIKPQPIEYNILIHNIYQSLLLIRNGVQDIISIAKVLKKLQLNRFADNFFRYFTLINTYWLTPEVIDISILLICYT